MNEIKCPACEELIPDDSLYCDMCGAELLECVACHTLGTDVFCPECGKPMVTRGKTQPQPVKEPVVEGQTPVEDGGDGGKTIGGRRKRIVLKAREGGYTLEPVDGAEIGRNCGPYAGVLRNNGNISRSHGKFVKQGRDWALVDFGSTNGSLVNDIELQPDVPMKFRVGDVVDIGTYLYDVIEL